MGLTFINAFLTNPLKPDKRASLKLLVDSGSMYSVIPANILFELGIHPTEKMSFHMVDGTKVVREIAEARFVIQGKQATSPVVFGKKGDSSLLGVVTLENMGLVLDPFKRELRRAQGRL